MENIKIQMLKYIMRFVFANLLAILFVSNLYAGEKIWLATGYWDAYISKNYKYYGVVSRIVSESFKSEGVEVKFAFYPWVRCELNVKEGVVDGASVYIPNKERETFAYFSNPVIKSKRVFFHLKSNPFNWKNWKDLEGLKIGKIIGNYYGPGFEKFEKSGKGKIYKVTRYKQIFQMMLIGRVDIFPYSLTAGKSLLRNQLPTEEAQLITYHPKAVHETEFRLMLSKKIETNRLMLKKFNRGLNRLKENGKYDQYFAESLRGEYEQ